MRRNFRDFAGFRLAELVISYLSISCLSICQASHVCRNVPFAMSNRELDTSVFQRTRTRRPTFAVNPSGRSEAQVLYSCPACGSDNTQRLSTAYMAGVSQFSAVTSGFGWARRFGGASGWTTGVSQTQMSQSVAPPAKRSYWQGVVLVATSPLLAALAAEGCRRIAELLHLNLRFGDLATAWFLLIVIAAIVLLTKAFSYNSGTWPKLLQLWNMSFSCSRCGQIFTPGLSP